MSNLFMDATSIKILEHPHFDLDDFSNRWQKARLSALKSVLTDLDIQNQSTTERELLKLIRPESKDLLLRRVFDMSRKFGMNASRFFEMSFEISDLADVLKAMSLPCFHGSWRSHNSAYVLERKGCAELKTLGSLGCDYWREALDGLVVGVGEDERLARHRSQGHGDAECVDVLFVEQYTVPRVVSGSSCEATPRSSKYGPVSSVVAESLKPTQSRFEKMKIKLVLEGESEGILYYRLDADEGVLCGAGGKLLHDSLSREITSLFPNLSVRDAAPLAVYGGST